MANLARGEIDIVLRGKTRLLRPTMNCLEMIEQAIGTDIHKWLTTADLKKSLSIEDTISIIKLSLVDDDGDFDEVGSLGEAIFEQGIYDVQSLVVDFLSRAMVGPKNLPALLEATGTPAAPDPSGSNTGESP